MAAGQRSTIAASADTDARATPRLIAREAGREARPGQPAVAIVVADGTLAARSLRALLRAEPEALLIAADGGARRVLAAGRLPHLVLGDGDSLDATTVAHLAELGVPLRPVMAEKDESDTELCLLAAVAAGARRIVLAGALGGRRPEHAVANLLLLADERFDDREIVLLAGTTRMRRIGTDDTAGTLELRGRRGDFVSLFALGGSVAGVRTEGLRFPLADETLVLGPARGLSNEMLTDEARVSTRRGRLLVVHSPRKGAIQEVSR